MLDRPDTTGAVDFGHSKIELLPLGIVRLVSADDHTYEVTDIKQNIDHIRLLSKKSGRKLPVMNVGGKFTMVSKDVREFVASAAYSSDCIVAEAFVVRSTAQKLVANFYLKMNKPKMPTAFFNNERDALEWLKKFL